MQLGVSLKNIGLAWLVCGLPETAVAKKTNQAVYEEPFDLAGGGSSLTRASREGVMFANPALMPWGEKFYRWLGLQTAVIAAKESIEFAQGAASGSSEEEGSATGAEVITKVLEDETPIHFGVMTALSFITNNFGFGVFGRFEPDIYGEQFGESGLPTVNISAEGYGGAVMSYAARATGWLSLGVTAKKLYVAEPDISLSISDQERIGTLADDPQALQEEASIGEGLGYDVGALIFLQGSFVDYRLALKVDDVGGTKFSGKKEPFKQTIHVGTGVTFHGSREALHLSVDYRDVQGVYDEKLFKRVYLGAKMVILNRFGLAAGLYQGIPSVGVRLDLFFLSVGLTAYGREMGTTVNDRQRNLYVAQITLGW